MPKTRLTLAAVAALSIGAFVLAGCGDDESSAATAPGTVAEASDFTVAVLFPGRINDLAFSQAGYEGAIAAQDELGFELLTSEAVPQAQMETTMRQYAEDDVDLVVGHGFQFSDAATALAPEYQDVQFLVNAGTVAEAPNLASANNDEWQAGYLTGVAAASITDSDTVAYMGGVPIPPIAQAGNAFDLGATSVNPDVEVLTTYTGSFDNPAKGKQTALSLIDQGADVIQGNANEEGIAAIKAAEERDVYAIGSIFNATDLAPETVVASGVVRLGVSMRKAIELAVAGELQPEVYFFGIADGSADLEWNPAFEDQFPEAVEAVEVARDQLIAGEIEAPATEPS